MRKRGEGHGHLEGEGAEELAGGCRGETINMAQNDMGLWKEGVKLYSGQAGVAE